MHQLPVRDTRALVITPTIGRKELAQAVTSVASQTYSQVEHLIVVDGPEYVQAVDEVLASLGSPKVTKLVLPFNTGAGGWFGHRIFAGISQLIPEHGYVFLLDEDNLYLPTHVEELVNLMESERLEWAHSLRTLISFQGERLIDDNSISVGAKVVEGTRITQGVDTSCYAFTRRFFNQQGPRWHQQGAGDWVFFRIVKDHSRFACTGNHTVLYRLKEDPAEEQRIFELIRDGNNLLK